MLSAPVVSAVLEVRILSLRLAPDFHGLAFGVLLVWRGMRRGTIFITGTDTGVGKTTLAVLLTRYLVRQGMHVGACKPLCSGDRADALGLQDACAGALPLDEVNPWHFRAPLAPVLAARREGVRVTKAMVLRHLRRARRRFDVIVIEGAGGLLTPLGEAFDARDLVAGLRALPVVVCPNRLGAVNQARLVLAALPPWASARAVVVLVNQLQPDLSSRTNAGLLREWVGPGRVLVLPWLGRRKAALPEVEALCGALCRQWGLGAKRPRPVSAPSPAWGSRIVD
jgi:dethiobiotin synthetase